MSIFLSYSHHDDRDPRNWVTKFHERLQTRLESLTGETIKVLKDNYDHQGNLLKQGIEDMINQSKLMIALVSPSYLNASWCTKERDFFLETLTKRGQDPAERLVVVIKLVKHGFHEVNHDFIRSLPDSLQSQIYFEFFSLDSNKHPVTLKQGDRDYDIEINDMAHKLVLFLHRAESIKEGAERKCIFISETSRDLDSKRKLLIKELELAGYVVFPSKLLPENILELKDEMQFYLKKSILSIHLIGASHGFLLPNGNSFSEFQYDIASESGIQMLTWLTDDKVNVEDKQKEFIQHLKNSLTSNNDLVESSFEDFKNDVFDKVKNDHR